MRVLLIKIQTVKKLQRVKRRKKVQRIQRKRHGGRVRRLRLRRTNLDAVHVVSVDGSMTMGMGILCGKV